MQIYRLHLFIHSMYYIYYLVDYLKYVLEDVLNDLNDILRSIRKKSISTLGITLLYIPSRHIT